ncbi:MAG: Threonine-tRNA ligase [Candidatus Magasanikbacteria bacterium GW2011_GWC2_37_14]|uniref:Threonine--tRNA ligase n=1 Tax=Candidatus Magasanikbacteria bacterium GW2011_GWC2_37_14 TaxID=1619046 RepID=A0A0G0GAR6_9BACT|nr:MAG: Threonine-tRNA ligase [Candidatus Magasanikbacteria bacterium GW2011_GWC2_37_14]
MEKEQLLAMRHSCEHVLTFAMMRLWPGKIKAAMGPATEEGFYFDFDSDLKIGENEFAKIEKEMAKIIKEDLPIIKDEMSVEEAREFFNGNNYAGNEYKHEWLDEIAGRGEKVSVYWFGHKGEDLPNTFVDICSGPHVESTGKIGAFKLLKVAGAYWHGDEKNKMLQRIYGTAFDSQEELDKYLYIIDEAEKRDHRKLGQELDLFYFSDLVGAGLPLFTDKGTVIREELQKFIWELMKPYGYTKVTIPHIAKNDLYKVSGHWDKFADDIFHVTSRKTDQEFVMKPMNCPHHTQIFAARARSYRDLPIRMSEVTAVYRDENTGQLQGLSRVRSITQDDAHVFCRLDQVQEEVKSLYEIIQKFYQPFGMPLKVELSLSDSKQPEKYLGDKQVWHKAESTLRDLLKDFKIDFKEVEGEAAFYGPKIDFKAQDAIGRTWQLATIQLDFNLPERFQLEYTDETGKKVRPVMLHRAVLGSVERFMSVLIEHYAGNFPVWLSPVQVQFVPVSAKFNDGVKALVQEFKNLNLRVELDDADETVGNRVRKAVEQKTPYIIVVGGRELEGGEWTVRLRGVEEQLKISKEEFVNKILSEIKERK